MQSHLTLACFNLERHSGTDESCKVKSEIVKTVQQQKVIQDLDNLTNVVNVNKSAILDKIYSNIGDWFEAPVVLPAITKSDHDSVIILPSQQGPLRPRRQTIDVYCRSSDHNGKAMLCQCLKRLDWRRLLILQECTIMVDFFYSTILSLLDYYLPIINIIKSSTDKPWVTPSFQRLVRSRQRAFLSGDVSRYHRLRNSISIVRLIWLTKMVGVIKRNFKYLSKSSFVLVYKSLVRCHLDYCNSVWTPYRKSDIETLEKVQKKATKILPKIKHLNYSDRLRVCNLPTLHYRRIRGEILPEYTVMGLKLA